MFFGLGGRSMTPQTIFLFGYTIGTTHGTTHSGYATTPVGCRGGNRYVEGDLLTIG